MEYLLSKGCEIVDAQSTSGRLWVIDTDAQSKQIVMSAKREFNVSFAKGKDQETKGRTVNVKPCAFPDSWFSDIL